MKYHSHRLIYSISIQFPYFISKYIIFSFLLNVLGWHWLIRLCRFHGYISIIHHLYIALCAHHPKSSQLCTLCLALHPLLLPTCLSSGNNHTVVSLCFCCCFYCFLICCFQFYITHISKNHMVLKFFCLTYFA